MILTYVISIYIVAFILFVNRKFPDPTHLIEDQEIIAIIATAIIWPVVLIIILFSFLKNWIKSA